ncbi:hypothetical protein [Pseudomonas sp. SCA2728.1_7]|uniref:hypothetical protein n=1 Tax=Pseudomonas sp. SCA2728.1_7 TaxID=2825975 RepID=UPI001BB0CEF8|nr:hypothetical protein [Pseudomonas sp. SCA2728.1_7]QUE90448.1 hypothetical protein KBP52_28210 [Pseudomonas sp. SCA2728.1_7]
MLVLIASPSSLLDISLNVNQAVVGAMTEIAKNNPVIIVSNKPQPDWFDTAFNGSNVKFQQVMGRQSGQYLKDISKSNNVATSNFLCLTASDEDYMMGKNGQAILIAAGWSNNAKARELGIQVADASELREVFELTNNWPGSWWFSGSGPNYGVRALADLSSYGAGTTQVLFSQKVTAAVKQGGGPLNALLAITSRSLLHEWGGEKKGVFFSVFPSSNPANYNNEVLTDFTHRLRTTVSRVRFESRDEPLFVRHSPSPKRSHGQGGDRTDPTSQIITLHLNPRYATNIKGKDVILIDDCTTYGLSFGVAAAFLKAAGAASMTGIALGKFGSRLEHYEIILSGNPYKPLKSTDFKLVTHNSLLGTTASSAQNILHKLIP